MRCPSSWLMRNLRSGLVIHSEPPLEQLQHPFGLQRFSTAIVSPVTWPCCLVSVYADTASIVDTAGTSGNTNVGVWLAGSASQITNDFTVPPASRMTSSLPATFARL